jgi:hypothetical protein
MPTLPVEYLPFIEASALTGDSDTALKLTSTVVREQKLLCPAVVQVWERVPKDEKTLTEVDTILQKGCSPASFSVTSKGE